MYAGSKLTTVSLFGYFVEIKSSMFAKPSFSDSYLTHSLQGPRECGDEVIWIGCILLPKVLKLIHGGCTHAPNGVVALLCISFGS